MGNEKHRAALARAACALLGSLLLLATGVEPTGARELAADREAFVEVEVAGVGITTSGVPAVLLRQPKAEEVVPIFIGPGQAQSIILGLRGSETPRPMTHDLLHKALKALGAELVRVYVDDMRNNTFYGMIELKVQGQKAPLRVDSRPSDALALGLRANIPIEVSPQVLEAARRLDYKGIRERIAKAAGITVNTMNETLRQALDLPDRQGVVVSEAIGPARQAGLRPGALITEVNGEVPKTSGSFRELIQQTPKGEQATITFWQDGESHRIKVPAELPQRHPAEQAITPA